MSIAAYYIVVHPDLSVEEVERRFTSTSQFALELFGRVKCLKIHGSNMAPVTHKLGTVKLMWRDPRDVSFDPMNPVPWRVAKKLAVGPIVVRGPRDDVQNFRQTYIAGTHPPMPQRINVIY